VIEMEREREQEKEVAIKKILVLRYICIYSTKKYLWVFIGYKGEGFYD
jgi:hypothetical protein